MHWGQQALERLLPEADLAFSVAKSRGFLAPLAIVIAQAAVGAAATVFVLRQTKGKAGITMNLAAASCSVHRQHISSVM